MKVVIVGGVAGGATAAARIRRPDEQTETVVFERSGFISYVKADCAATSLPGSWRVMASKPATSPVASGSTTR